MSRRNFLVAIGSTAATASLFAVPAIGEGIRSIDSVVHASTNSSSNDTSDDQLDNIGKIAQSVGIIQTSYQLVVDPEVMANDYRNEFREFMEEYSRSHNVTGSTDSQKIIKDSQDAFNKEKGYEMINPKGLNPKQIFDFLVEYHKVRYRGVRIDGLYTESKWGTYGVLKGINGSDVVVSASHVYKPNKIQFEVTDGTNNNEETTLSFEPKFQTFNLYIYYREGGRILRTNLKHPFKLSEELEYAAFEGPSSVRLNSFNGIIDSSKLRMGQNIHVFDTTGAILSTTYMRCNVSTANFEVQNGFIDCGLGCRIREQDVLLLDKSISNGGSGGFSVYFADGQYRLGGLNFATLPGAPEKTLAIKFDPIVNHDGLQEFLSPKYFPGTN